jgi:hypothetical protein
MCFGSPSGLMNHETPLGRKSTGIIIFFMLTINPRFKRVSTLSAPFAT